MTAKIDGTSGLLQQYDYQVLTTAFTYTFAAGTTVLVINPAGTLATGTITMPAAPADGMTISFSSTQTITALTVNANTGQSIVGAPTVLPANQAGGYVYRLSNTTWYPFESVPTNVPVAPAGGSIITSGTAVTLTTQTSIDFTSIPSWVKRITVMFYAVSTNAGSNNFLVQLGTSSGIVSSGYVGQGIYFNPAVIATSLSSGFNIAEQQPAATHGGSFVLTLVDTNKWVGNGLLANTNTFGITSGYVPLGGTLDRVRITTVNGTAAFDAGSINILYE